MTRLSNKTLARMAEAMSSALGQSDIKALFFEFNIETYDSPDSNKQHRIIAFLSAIQRLGHADARQATIDILERLPDFYRSEALVASLKVDGLEFTEEGRLVPTIPGVVSIGDSVSGLEQTLERRGLPVAREHYRQAVDNYTDGNPEACNGQLRSYLEDLLVGICRLRTNKVFDNPGAALQHLKQVGFLDDDEFNMFRAFWHGVQDNGPHAGLSNDQEAMFRLHSATAISAYLFHKLDS